MKKYKLESLLESLAFWKKDRTSIQDRLMKMSMATSGMAILLTCLLFIGYGIMSTRIMVTNELTLVSQIIGNRVGPALDWGDKETAQDSLDDLKIKDSVIVACIYDKEKNIFAKYLGDKNAYCPPPPSKNEISRGWSRLSVYNIINFHNADVGSVYIESDIRDITKEIPNYVGFSLMLTLVVGILAYMISSHYRNIIANPILHLVEATKNVINEDHYSIRAQKQEFENDEVGTLADSFNEMLSEIESRDQKLKEAKENLEQKIKERTHDLEVAKVKAEAANDAKSEFLRNMSHEFRTPLHGMANMASFGIKEAETAAPSALKAYFQKIAKVTTRLTELVDGVLNISRMENGSEEFIMGKADIAEMFDIIKMEQAPLFQQKNLELVCIKPDFDTEIMCHRGKIIQVVANFVGNAVKFTPSGKKITISAKRDKHNLSISVSDEGVGIPDAELEAIFDKFVQSTRTKTGAGGTGLGLAICKGIIHGHDGKIWAENNKNGEGSTFTFTIPYGLAEGKKIVQPEIL